jgi:hypothetical protein
MSIPCVLIPRPDATPDQLRRLGRALFDWHCDSGSNCSWLEHTQLLDLLAGKLPTSLTHSMQDRIAELEPADRDRVKKAWVMRDGAGVYFSVFCGNFDRGRTIAGLRQFTTSDLSNLVQDILIDDKSWNIA